MDNAKQFYFTNEHEWVCVIADIAYIGISDYAQHAMGEIVYVDMPAQGDILNQTDDFGAVESVKSASDLYMPVSGEVIEINEELEITPSLINDSPYETWIIKVRMSDDLELDELMSKEEYDAFVEGLE